MKILNEFIEMSHNNTSDNSKDRCFSVAVSLFLSLYNSLPELGYLRVELVSWPHGTQNIK